jgi:hypothetical protein
MNLIPDYIKALGLKEQSENLFREKCDENNFTYMYLEHEQAAYCSEIWKDMNKRPDYILSIPNFGSVFIDVKAFGSNQFYKDVFKILNKTPPMAFSISKDELSEYFRLQEETSINVWYAIMLIQDNQATPDMYFLPVDRVKKFSNIKQRDYHSWKYIQVPINCFTKCSHFMEDRCNICQHRYCEELENILDIQKSINVTNKGYIKV